MKYYKCYRCSNILSVSDLWVHKRVVEVLLRCYRFCYRAFFRKVNGFLEKVVEFFSNGVDFFQNGVDFFKNGGAVLENDAALLSW